MNTFNDSRYTGKRKALGYIAVLLVFAMVITGISLSNLGKDNSLIGKYATAESGVQDGLGTGLAKIESPFEKVYDLVNPAVVGVKVITNTRIGQGRITTTSQLAGSGVVIQEGYVLTNYHVVEGGSGFTITVGDKDYPAEYVGGDEVTDVAILKVEGLDVEPVALGDSDALKVGEWALVIGTPLSERLANTLTVGVISGLDREVQTVNQRTRTYTTNYMIQIDAAINSGNSGGALFNTRGELIGIPSLKMSSASYYGMVSIEGIGMAIPINRVKSIIEELIQYKKVLRPRIGVKMSTLDSPSDDLTEDYLPASVLIIAVEDGSPAQEAGIKVNDLILEADGQRVKTTDELSAIVQSYAAGEKVTLKVLRIPGIGSLKESDKIPEGEYLDIEVELKILDAD